MSFQLAVATAETSHYLSFKTGKDGKVKTGSFARALAYASREVREDMGRQLYAQWLSNGQYRPVVNDIIDVLVPKPAQGFLTAMVPMNGPVKRDQLMQLCVAVDNYLIDKARAKGADLTLKGQKAFVYGVVQRIAAEAAPECVDAE
jgi:hypothetical protein